MAAVCGGTRLLVTIVSAVSTTQGSCCYDTLSFPSTDWEWTRKWVMRFIPCATFVCITSKLNCQSLPDQIHKSCLLKNCRTIPNPTGYCIEYKNWLFQKFVRVLNRNTLLHILARWPLSSSIWLCSCFVPPTSPKIVQFIMLSCSNMRNRILTVRLNLSG